jgi:glycosyltransferase involved in cell wall biosynthesis
MAPRLWVDVEDLFEYVRGNPRPSGIQRLAFEMYQDMNARFGDTGLLHFVRHDPLRNSFAIVAWHDVEQLFAGLTRTVEDPAADPSGPSPPSSPTASGESAVPASPELPLPAIHAEMFEPIRPHSRPRQAVRRLVYRLPPDTRSRAIRAIRSQAAALRAYVALLRDLLRLIAWAPPALIHAVQDRRRATLAPISSATESADTDREPPPSRFGAMVRPGDILLSLGSPWSHPDYGDLLQRHRERFGLRVAILIYDLIPLRRPEFCDRGLVRLFRAWFEGTLPQCDAVFAISRASADDVEAYARQHGQALPGPVIPIPIGTGFSDDRVAPAAAIGSLPAPGSYALIVSTIEARKNHLLLFRVWRRLLDELPADQVPTLVFAGRIGWMVDDLLRMIANTNRLDGKLVIIENPGDAELRALYQGCLFTLFPSFYEGWGLPVTESLALGKPCIIADRTSLPEAGGHLSRRFDPDNLHDAFAVIRDTILDRDGLADWEAQVRREFQPVPWSDTVDRLLEGLHHPLAMPQAETV